MPTSAATEAQVRPPAPLPPPATAPRPVPAPVRDQPADDDRIVPGHRAGPMGVGFPASDLAEVWGAGRQRPAKQGDRYRWWEYPEQSAWMLVERGLVIRVGVESADYVTQEGFQVGSRARDIVARWGPGQRRRAVPWNEQPDERELDVMFDPHRPPERFFLDYVDRGITFLVDTALDRVMSIQLFPPGSDPSGGAPKGGLEETPPG